MRSDAYTSAEIDSAVERLTAGSASAQTVAAVYDICFSQIMENYSYAATPFIGSHGVRNILEDNLVATAEKGRIIADTMKSAGHTEDEIIAAIDTDAAFDIWLSGIKTALEQQGTAWK